MASLLPEVLFEARGQAAAPSKDFYQILVNRKNVIFRWWKISLRSEFREARPGETRETHEDFLDNPSLQIQIAYIFGTGTLDHIFNLCQGKFDFLTRLPDVLLLHIVAYLDLEDLSQLALVSHRFERIVKGTQIIWWPLSSFRILFPGSLSSSSHGCFQEAVENALILASIWELMGKNKLCNSDKLWEMIVQNLCGNITEEMTALAHEMGWKQFFFTNKLQLQRQLRRRRQKEVD